MNNKLTSSILPPKNPSNRNVKKVFWWLLLWTLMLASCSDKKDAPKSEPDKPNFEEIQEVISTESISPKDVQETREYKVYKLWLWSIVPIKWDIQRAKVKISNTPELSKLLTWEDVDFETILPSIIKESMMNADAKSNSWAVWYFQLKPIAVKDVVAAYDLQNLKLDVNNPVDNVILWSLYRKRSMKLLKEWLTENISEKDLEKMMILSYNVWPARSKSLFKESRAKNYQDFEKFLARKIWARKSPTKTRDKTYWVDFMDPISDVDISKLKTNEDKKVAEGERYVAIIDWMTWYIKSSETIQILWKITCDENTTLFSAVKKLREQWVFKADSSVNAICKVILETNGYKDTQTPKNTELLLIKEPLESYLNNI